MRDEQLLAYLKGSCSGRKNRVGGTGLEAAINGLERSMDRFREDEEVGHG